MFGSKSGYGLSMTLTDCGCGCCSDMGMSVNLIEAYRSRSKQLVSTSTPAKSMTLAEREGIALHDVTWNICHTRGTYHRCKCFARRTCSCSEASVLAVI